jgi:hypothetical protein
MTDHQGDYLAAVFLNFIALKKVLVEIFSFAWVAGIIR